ncbi:MAG: hypothetical protein GX115_00310 [Ruminiclostridium sp.]|nr:hypothetical protein [Ruminiclostridium sp.]
MAEVFEAAMVICFGISWPVSILKSFRSGTNKGKSIVFIIFILLGYACGILSKIFYGKMTYVFIFYVLNFLMVTIDFALYFRNARLDKLREFSELSK